jgi:hypothetical protein
MKWVEDSNHFGGLANPCEQELGGGPRVEDLIASLRTGPSAPVQKSQDVIAGAPFPPAPILGLMSSSQI